MEGNVSDLPRVNSIFRGQPSYTYFSKTLEDDPHDALFLTLNDIDSTFLEPEQIADVSAFDTFYLVDPRTKQTVEQYLFDHTVEVVPKRFYSPKSSALNKAQHSMGVRIVKARQEEMEVTEDEFLIWHRLEKIRQKETQEFTKFVYAFNQTNKEKMYTPARKMLEEYKKWYGSKCQRLKAKYVADSYNTHLGLPHVKVCKTVLQEQSAEVTQVNILKELGERLHWDNSKKLEFVNMKRSLETYGDDYINSEDLKENLEHQMKVDCLKIIEQEDANIPMFYIPLESLLFLMTSGDYCDLPTELLLDIKEHDGYEDGEKYLVFESPLPSRHSGWHTYKQVAEQASVDILSLCTEQQTDTEITSKPSKEPQNFSAKSCKEYMKTCGLKPNKKCRFSKTLSKWQLKASGHDVTKHIYTTTDTAPKFLGAYSVKLEYKPTFGCELMTKYELMREWFKLKLQQDTKSTCFRLDINNFQTLLIEQQSEAKLEHLLATNYRISMSQLLSNLYEFFSLLSSMPCGHYMLRYNPKFNDKLMLCKPSQEITQNTVHLHQLLNTDPSELLFMSQQNYLPIADDLCSSMHIFHNTLPCTFAPLAGNRRGANNQKPFELLNDKAKIVEKIKKKRILESNKRNAPIVNKKRAQRARRKQRLANLKAEAAKDKQELEDEMKMDEQILGF